MVRRTSIAFGKKKHEFRFRAKRARTNELIERAITFAELFRFDALEFAENQRGRYKN